MRTRDCANGAMGFLVAVALMTVALPAAREAPRGRVDADLGQAIRQAVADACVQAATADAAEDAEDAVGGTGAGASPHGDAGQQQGSGWDRTRDPALEASRSAAAARD